jgi:hypothetical protein
VTAGEKYAVKWFAVVDGRALVSQFGVKPESYDIGVCLVMGYLVVTRVSGSGATIEATPEGIAAVYMSK